MLSEWVLLKASARNPMSSARDLRIFTLCKCARCAPALPLRAWQGGSRCGKKPTHHAWALTLLYELPTPDSSALDQERALANDCLRPQAVFGE